jgi:uncharacterized SAM-dependent methyltransferase
MSALVNVAVHSSQFPERVRRDLLDSLRTRQVNHKFHYDSVKQTQKWLALHAACSPSRTDADCAATYDRSFAAVAERIAAGPVHVIGLGCGGGQKDSRLLRLLAGQGREIFYTPVDVSVAMVLVARHAAATVIPETNCFPLVCDLATAADLPALVAQVSSLAWNSDAAGCAQQPLSQSLPHSLPVVPGDHVCDKGCDNPESFRGAGRDKDAASAARLVTFFGMVPNFEPEVILPQLAGLARAGDVLLVSANLAPGADYAVGVQRILPLYDNALTRDWLMAFLLDLGVEASDGEVEFRVEARAGGGGLLRVAADFHFRRPRAVQVEAERFEFRAGDSIRLFFSWRHTPALLRAQLRPYRLQILGEWITKSGEEGIFLSALTKGAGG